MLERLGPATAAARRPAEDLGTIVDAVDANKEGIGILGDRFSGVLSTNDANGPILRGLGLLEPFNPEDLGFGPAASGPHLTPGRDSTPSRR